MKKINNILINLAVLLLASCSMETNTEIKHHGEPIVVTTEVDASTRAGYEGITKLPAKFIMDIVQGEDETYNYTMLEMSKDDSGNTYSAPADMKLYWADADHSNVSIKALTIPYGLTAIDEADPMEVNVCLDQSTDEGVMSSDLLGATTNEDISIDGNSINICFNHLMSKLAISFVWGSQLGESSVSIESVKLNNICVSGGYSYANMTHDTSVSLGYDNITMYHDSEAMTAEAIFYPYTPSENPTLDIGLKIDDESRTFNTSVPLESGDSFDAGKVYNLRITVEGTSISDATVTTIKDWESESIGGEMSGESVLWVGTSIPAGYGDNNYPRMVADELGFELYNNARGSSFVCFYDSASDGTDSWKTATSWEDYENQVWKGYSLSASIAEIEAKFNRTDYPESVLPEWLLESFRNHSYERLIIPYIDGSIAKCTTLIIDHGYNDRAAIINECSWHPTDGDRAPGYAWLRLLADNTNNTSEGYLQGWLAEYKNESDSKTSYFRAISHIIQKCLEVNPRLRIIIGNYFAWKTPLFTAEYGNDNCCNLVCGANEAVAGMWMRDIVNVYKYTGIRNFNYNGINDFMVFCPDGVHPHSDETGQSNRIIAGIYINALKGLLPLN